MSRETPAFVVPGLKNPLLANLICNPPVEIASALKDLDTFFGVTLVTTNVASISGGLSTGVTEQITPVAGKKRKGTSKAKRKSSTTGAWVAGTGFGGRQGDAAGLKAKVDLASKQEEKNDATLQSIVEKLRKFVPMVTSSFQLRQKLEDSEGWCTLCFQLLRNDSFLDVGKRMKLYQPFLAVLLQLSKQPSTMEFLSYPLYEEDDDGSEGADDSSPPTCKQLLESLGAQARVYRQLQGAAKQSDKRLARGQVIEVDESVLMADLIIDTVKAVNSFVDLTDDTTACAPCGSSSALKNSVDVFDLTGDDDDMVVWVPSSSSHSAGTSSSSSSSSNKRQRTSAGAAAPPTTATATATATAPAGTAPAAQDESQYVKAMTSFRFAVVDMCSLIAAGQASHLFFKTPLGTAPNPKQRMSRIAKEMATLSANLPVEYGSSIFVRVDEARMDLVKALIIGPEGTPYENGCFEFDILLPAQYPQAPPQMLLVTTGRGTVRFNPNLYNCGKVCLSLLGTWSGPGWDPQLSTLLQVLVSIQALILVPDPYYNEPGYENGKHNAQSEGYNKNIRLQCMRFAMREQLTTPSPLFADAIRAHFRNKRTAIGQQLQRWASDTPAHKTAAREVEAELAKLA